jgi:single-strand DNA-binding protein
VEKFSTEVVLQNYRGELTMLDGRGGEGASSSGSEFGQASPLDRPKTAGKAQSFTRDLDDEVPF